MPLADVHEASRRPAPDHSLEANAINVQSANFVASDEGTNYIPPTNDCFNFLGLPDSVRNRIYWMSCPATKVYPSATSANFRFTLVRVKEGTSVTLSGTTRPWPQHPLAILSVNTRLRREVRVVMYMYSIHVLGTFRHISQYLNMMRPWPNVLSRIKTFEVPFSALDFTLDDPLFWVGKPLSCAELRISQLIRPEDQISGRNLLSGHNLRRGFRGNNPETRDDHDTFLSALLMIWESKKKRLLDLIGPERIILRLEQAACPEGCHRLHRCALYIWMDDQNRLPPTLRVRGLPPEEVLDDFVTEFRGTKWPVPALARPDSS